MEAAEEAVGQCRALVRDQVERVVHQVTVEQGDRGGARPLHQVCERAEMGLLALVQRQRASDFNQRRGFRAQAGVVGDREHPGFSEMRHREPGSRFTRLVEQCDGIAMDEVERADRVVEDRGGLGRRAGERVSLGILDHCGLPCSRTSFYSAIDRPLSSFPRKREPRVARVRTVPPWTPACAGVTSEQSTGWNNPAQ